MSKSNTSTLKKPFIALFGYLRGSKEELEKVTWPARREVIRHSSIVVFVSILLAALFAGLDWLLQKGLEALITLAAR